MEKSSGTIVQYSEMVIRQDNCQKCKNYTGDPDSATAGNMVKGPDGKLFLIW
jgi:hypothetical protein